MDKFVFFRILRPHHNITRFVGTQQPVTGVENPSKQVVYFKNKLICDNDKYEIVHFEHR